MKKDCFGGPGQWYKGNLHSHTTNSDGHLTPAQAVALFRQYGYSFLCLSEHDYYTDLRAELDREDFILLPGGKPGNVYYFTTENDESIVLRPRLEAMDARLDRVMVMRSDARQLTLTDPRLFEMHKIFDGKPDLIVFDPVQSYVGKKLDMNRTDDVRFMMDNLNKLLHATNAAVVLICHTKKAPMGFNGRPCELINGSSDFVNAARSVCFLGRDPARPDVCVVAQEKNSLGLPGASLAFTIGEDGAVHWSDEECELTAAQILTYSDEKRRHAASPSERAQAVMRRMLIENKTMQSSDVLAACEKQGISRATVYRARKGLPIQEERSGREKYWSLSDASQMSQPPVQGKAET